MNSPEHDCAAQVMYLLPSAEAADAFVAVFPSVIAAGRAPQLHRVGSGADRRGRRARRDEPYLMPQNRDCRRSYSKDMCQRSLEVLNRTVMVPTHPRHRAGDRRYHPQHRGRGAGRAGGMSRDEADLRNVQPVDAQKFDLEESVHA